MLAGLLLVCISPIPHPLGPRQVRPKPLVMARIFDHVLIAAFATCFALVSLLRRTSMIEAIFSEKGFRQ